MIDKKTFIGTLQYGLCPGTPYRLDECYWNNAAEKSAPCPDKRNNEPCNCCERCRKECRRANAIKKINRRNRMDDLEAMKRALDEE